MKVTVKKEDPGFVPTTVSITFTSQAEKDAFLRVAASAIAKERYTHPNHILWSARRDEARVMEAVKEAMVEETTDENEEW